MQLEHHRDLAHEFPELRHSIHELKLTRPDFRQRYEECQVLDNEIHRIEQDIEASSDDYTDELKRRRVRLKDRLCGILTGHIPPPADTAGYVVRGRFRRPVDHGKVARDWIARGYDCRGFTDPPGQEWHGGMHDTGERVTVVEGALEITLHDERWRLEPGDKLFIPRGARHTVRNIHAGINRRLDGCD